MTTDRTYSVSAELARRSGLAEGRYRTADGRFIMSESDIRYMIARRILSIGTGGLSGPCIKPVALRMVYQVAHAVTIPVIGLGGISNAKDALEFLLAGAAAIEIGTANFIDPAISVKVAEGINSYLDRHGFGSVKEIVGICE